MAFIAVDDHQPYAAFPQPGSSTLDGLVPAPQALGSETGPRRTALPMDDSQLLTGAAHALVKQRLTGG